MGVRFAAIASFLAALLLTVGIVHGAPGEVRYIHGTVEVRSGPKADWRRAVKGQKLLEGWEVQTLRRAKAELRLAGGQIVRMEEQSHLSIPSSRLNSKKRVSVIELIAGGIWCRVQKLIGGESFQVQTPTAVAGVRGTIFSVSYDRTQQQTRVDLADGRVEVMCRKTFERMRLAPGEACRINHLRGMGPRLRVDKALLMKRFEALAPPWRRSLLDLRRRRGAVPAAGGAAATLRRLKQELSSEAALVTSLRRIASRYENGASPSANASSIAQRMLAQSARRAGRCEKAVNEAPSREALGLLKRFLKLHQELKAMAESLAGGEGHLSAAASAAGKDGDRASDLELSKYRNRCRVQIQKVLMLCRRMANQPITPNIKSPSPSYFVSRARQFERKGRLAMQRFISAGGDASRLRGDFDKASMLFSQSLQQYEARLKQTLDAATGRIDGGQNY